MVDLRYEWNSVALAGCAFARNKQRQGAGRGHEGRVGEATGFGLGWRASLSILQCAVDVRMTFTATSTTSIFGRRSTFDGEGMGIDGGPQG
jgi:hypothetical protein